jgi:two-component system sensor histidine kinase BaeS
VAEPGRGPSLTVRAVLVTCLVALLAVLITAAVALPLARRTAVEQARAVLADKARVAAEVIEGRNTPASDARAQTRARRVAQALRQQGVETVLVRDGRPDRAGLPDAVTGRVAGGAAVSEIVRYEGRLMYAEGRPAGPGDGIVLLQPVVTLASGAVLGRLWLALTAGLLAGLVAGALLARRLARPLRAVAVAARRLSAGDRGVRAPTAVPPEVADVSVALNDLAAALAASEDRQRSFLLSVSHELRTPLTTIKGYAEALVDGVVGPDSAQRAGQTVLAESRRLDRLIEDLLALARLEADDFALELADVDLVALAATAAESWAARSATAGVTLRAELPPVRIVVRTDPGRVRQVVDGLLENAVRVLPAGAPVVLAVRGAGPGGPGLVEVRDGGPGLTDDDLAIVFERGALSQRYRGVRKVGSGVGLALAARLVARLGGRIEAGHAPEGGVRFSVLLPPAPGDQTTQDLRR